VLTIGEKVRPVLNVSERSGLSFNDNVDKLSVERVVMDTARSFSYKLLRAGKNARLDKTDVKDAFKNVPAKTGDLRLQGFMVEDRYFIELRMIFGARTAMAHYDILGNTVEKLAIIDSGIPRHFVSRAIDDQPVATPANSSWGEKFVSSYKKICKELNIELAEDCTRCDKAFTNTKRGKVLGVWFDSESLTWKLPAEKTEATRLLLRKTVTKRNVNLEDMQSLLGRLNFVCMMCPFLKAFRFNMNKELASRILDPSLRRELCMEAKADLMVHDKFLADMAWYPIAKEPIAAPPSATYFVTDAAGFPDNAKWSGPIGCGLVGFNDEGSMIHAAQYFWPKEFIVNSRDSAGIRFGNKSTTLECIGLLIPLLTAPELLAGRHVVLRVDNIACVYGFENGQLKNDETASIMIRAAKLVAAYLGTVLHVEHVGRRSCWEAELADNLSRERTTSFIEQRALSRFTCKRLPCILNVWLNNPISDWSIPLKLLKHMQAVI
jgi:hypothetical protein